MGSVTLSGSAAHNGELWGARAHDWAVVEQQQLPTYEEAIRRVDVRPGDRVLDVGCGSGVFLRAAADRGAQVFGLDASEPLLEIAREVAPEADLRLGDMQALPYDDDSFDVVAGFNTFFFADDMVAALREAGRVAKPGGPVVIQVWGRPERCDLTPMKDAIRSFLPSPSDAPPMPALYEPGALEVLAADAGLRPDESFDVSWAYEFEDDESTGRAMGSACMPVDAARAAGEEPVHRAIVESLAPHRRGDG